MYNDYEILNIANELGIDFSKFSFDDFKRGIQVELEHGLVNPVTNITNDALLETSKIALAHLNELPNYYNKDYGLSIFEEFLKSKLK